MLKRCDKRKHMSKTHSKFSINFNHVSSFPLTFGTVSCCWCGYLTGEAYRKGV